MSEPAAPALLDEAVFSGALREPEVDVTLFVPCLNEAPRIGRTLGAIREAAKGLDASYEVIVVDDGSTDGTSEAALDFQRRFPDLPLRLYRNAVNVGLARSYVDAAFAGRGEWFRMIWGDDIEPPESIAKVLSHMGQADLVVPYYPNVQRSSALRAGLSRAYTALVNALSGHRLRYYNGSLLCRRYDVVRWAPRTAGFTGFLADMITLLLDNGATVIEIPVEARDSGDEKAGEGTGTSLSARNLFSTGHTLLQIGLRRVRNRFFDTPHHRRLGHR